VSGFPLPRKHFWDKMKRAERALVAPLPSPNRDATEQERRMALIHGARRRHNPQSGTFWHSRGRE
jgi:hypothetical protein